MCRLIQLLKGQPTPPKKPDYSKIYTSLSGNTVEKLGNCHDGSYIEIYKPGNPYRDQNGNLKAVIYLHGFDLGASQIYGTHLDHLVKQGYHVFYPNFQHGFCEFHKYLHLWEFIQLLAETMSPYPISPVGWINSAIDSTTQAYELTGLLKKEVDTYIFGHSIGGLFALSWSYYAKRKVPDDLMSKMLPKQIIVADPVPDSQSNIPPNIRELIEHLGGFKDKVDIKETGADLMVPVAILHGNEDTIVPQYCWIKPFFQHIGTNDKAMYLSFSDDHGSPSMHADHEQATVDTSFVLDTIARKFLDGVGTEDNLNWRYIWYALDQVIRFGAKAHQLKFDMDKWSEGTPVKPIQLFLSHPVYSPSPNK